RDRHRRGLAVHVVAAGGGELARDRSNEAHAVAARARRGALRDRHLHDAELLAAVETHRRRRAGLIDLVTLAELAIHPPNLTRAVVVRGRLFVAIGGGRRRRRQRRDHRARGGV